MKLTELITAIHALYVRLHAGEVAAWRELETLCMQTPAEIAPAVLASPRIQALLPALRAGRDLRTLFYADIAESDLRGFTVRTAAVTGAAQLEIVACKCERMAL